MTLALFERERFEVRIFDKVNLSGLATFQQTFQRCFNVAFWLMRHRDMGQRQTNVETTLGISTLKCTMSNNVESTLCTSKLT